MARDRWEEIDGHSNNSSKNEKKKQQQQRMRSNYTKCVDANVGSAVDCDVTVVVFVVSAVIALACRQFESSSACGGFVHMSPGALKAFVHYVCTARNSVVKNENSNQLIYIKLNIVLKWLRKQTSDFF